MIFEVIAIENARAWYRCEHYASSVHDKPLGMYSPWHVCNSHCHSRFRTFLASCNQGVLCHMVDCCLQMSKIWRLVQLESVQSCFDNWI